MDGSLARAAAAPLWHCSQIFRPGYGTAGWRWNDGSFSALRTPGAALFIDLLAQRLLALDDGSLPWRLRTTAGLLSIFWRTTRHFLALE
jgi:hypothetical protein